MDELHTKAVTTLILVVIFLSTALWARLVQRLRAENSLLPYQPRKPVPWNALAPLVMLAPLVAIFQAALAAEPPPAPPPELAATTAAEAAAASGAPPAVAITIAASAEAARARADDQSITGALWIQSLVSLAMGLGCYAMLAVAFGASATDLGLPATAQELGQDAYLGATTFLASVAPTYGLMLVLSLVFQPESGHPLVDQLVSDHSLGAMAAAAFAAVVAAPIYEETIFRLTLQGWLERRDMLAQPVQVDAFHSLAAPDTDGLTGEPSTPVENTETAPAFQPRYAYAAPTWLPIAISSVLFGLAHYGHGVSPVPLMVLGVMLGYVYRQTHRIVPCIVCHAMFNAFTFVQLAVLFGV